MKPTLRTHPEPVTRLAQGALAFVVVAGALLPVPAHAALALGNVPLYLSVGKANVLVMLDNSNSMDEAANGSAVGSNSATSKSEIARGAVRQLTDTYRNRINMGLMTYRQNDPSASALHNSPYDVSFNSANYDAGFTGNRDSQTKRFRISNPTSPGNFVNFNVALPFYAGSSQGNAFCYSNTADASHNFNGTMGSWDTYRCFTGKLGNSNALPDWRNAASEDAAGYRGFFFEGQLSPTDSDFAQGILDFGRFLTWNYVGPTWFRNDSPGRGYLNIPLGDLDNTQAGAIKAKLACNVPGNPAPCTASGIRNAGLTPIEGTLLTARDYFNGTWTNAAEGYTPNCYPLPTSCNRFVVLLTDGLPSNNKNGVAISDPAQAISEAAAAAAALKAAGVETYVIGFALPTGTDATTLNQIAIAGGTTASFLANDQASLEAAFNSIFLDILRKASAYGSVSQNSTAINAGSKIFQGRFQSTDWSGELQALRPEVSGDPVMQWTTNTAGLIPAPADRKVFTLKPGSGGVAFKTLNDLSAAQQTALATTNCSVTLTGAACAQARINWVRGDQSLEETLAGPDSNRPMRRRSHVMGDVISSSPFYVKSSNTVFVGANDGMLHAFNAETGAEQFAFVPNAVIANLPALTPVNYTHTYYVDGEIAVSTVQDTPGKNILVGALGRGGKALYALNVTSPSTFGAANVMWEFTDPDLGLVTGRPLITKLNSGQTVVIVGNGYNSNNERAVLFIIDLETGALIRKIDTQAGSAAASNGLATPRGWDADGNGTLDLIYAGDLLGNVWKIGMRAAAAASWGFAYLNGAVPAPMFVATDSLGNRQPITGQVSVGLDYRKGDVNFGKRFVFVGTGRYLTASDVTSTRVQSWYGLIDDEVTAIVRNELKLRAITDEGVIDGNAVRAFENAVVGDMTGKRGWVLDMVSPVNGNLGERFTSEQKFLGNVLLATSMIPKPDTCQPGGDGFLNAIDPFSGASLQNLFFNANGDNAYNDADRLNGKVVGSFNPNLSLISDGILLGNGPNGRLIVSGTNGGIGGPKANIPLRSGRISWREVVQK